MSNPKLPPSPRLKLTLTREDATTLLYDELEGYKIIENEMIGTSRWSVHHRVVIKRHSDGKFFQDTYSVGATESQDERPWEYSPPNFTEVFETTKTITTYE